MHLATWYLFEFNSYHFPVTYSSAAQVISLLLLQDAHASGPLHMLFALPDISFSRTVPCHFRSLKSLLKCHLINPSKVESLPLPSSFLPCLVLPHRSYFYLINTSYSPVYCLPPPLRCKIPENKHYACLFTDRSPVLIAVSGLQ